MIVTERGDEFLLITQPDHAALAGALMALWRNDGLPDHPKRNELLLAIREHDNGWREADAAPRVDPESGRPLAFHELPHEDRIGLWRRGVRRFAEERPFTAQLILRHALEIHRDYWGFADWKEFGAELAELEEELRETSGVDPPVAESGYRLLKLADTLSLGACGALGARSWQEAAGSYRFEVELGRIGLAPFPLAGATTLQIAYRSLPRKSFDSATDLAAELATATWKRLPVHIEPLKGEKRGQAPNYNANPRPADSGAL